MLRIIDNKRIEMTDDEYQSYNDICNAYVQGKDLFKDLFETDENGIIIFIKTPSKMFSLEALLFIQNLMVHQHLRIIYGEFRKSMEELNQMKQDLLVMLKKE
jgi:hypothetical protein